MWLDGPTNDKSLPIAAPGVGGMSSTSQVKSIHIVGFGSQGQAWAQCLYRSGWNVSVYVSHNHSPSFEKALKNGFSPQPIQNLSQAISAQSQTHWIAMLCPDLLIGPIYGDFVSGSKAEIRIILAHGYSVYSKDLQLRSPFHKAALLAPKAIGPKLLENFLQCYPEPHSLKAGFFPPEGEDEAFVSLGRDLGFGAQSLIPTTFDQETIGDLISEQGLLCGGLFNLFIYTVEAMKAAGIPSDLIKEECLTELDLMAGMIRSFGLSKTFESISQAAQAGTIAMHQRFIDSGYPTQFYNQVKQVESKGFAAYFRSNNWKPSAQDYLKRLKALEEHL